MYQVKDTEIAMFDFELGGKTYSVPQRSPEAPSERARL